VRFPSFGCRHNNFEQNAGRRKGILEVYVVVRVGVGGGGLSFSTDVDRWGPVCEKLFEASREVLCIIWRDIGASIRECRKCRGGIIEYGEEGSTSTEQRAESIKQRAESREQRAERREQRA
jgi:hypothetical protein